MTFPAATVTLSTGRQVTLPLRCEADVVGALFSADWEALRRAVPRGLTPVRLGPRTGGVVVAGVAYSQAGDFDPYNELAVIVPVARRSVAGVGIPHLDGGLGGYVVALPVTTEDSCRMGREVWGYPKTVADIEMRRDERDSAEPRETSDSATDWHVDVYEDETRALSLTVRETRRHSRETTLDSYTRKDGRLWRTPVDVLGPVGLGVGPGRVDLDVGSGALATDLDRLEIHHPLGRFTGRIRAHVQAGESASESDYRF